MAFLWGNPAEQTSGFSNSNDADPKHIPNTVVCEVDSTNGLRCYKYLQYDNGTAGNTAANGNPTVYDDGAAPDNTFLIDVSDSHRNLVAGICLNVVTDAQYGWIQIKGYHSAVDTNGDDDVAIGQSIIHSNTDAQVDSVAVGTAPTNNIYGWANTADIDADNTVAMLLNCSF